MVKLVSFNLSIKRDNVSKELVGKVIGERISFLESEKFLHIL